MSEKLIKLGVVVIAVIVLVAVGFVSGYNWCNSGKQAATIDQLEKDRDAVADVRELDKERKKETVKIKEVIIRVPSDNCYDAPGPVDADKQLLKAYQRLERP